VYEDFLFISASILTNGVFPSTPVRRRGRWIANANLGQLPKAKYEQLRKIKSEMRINPVVIILKFMVGNPAMKKKAEKKRCHWVGEDPLYIKYHDGEWGVPVFNDKVFFEFLILEGAQAGLSWITVLRKRKNYRKHFCGFDPKKVAKLKSQDCRRILKDPGIIRNRLKVHGTVINAKKFLEVQREFGSFSKYVWAFVGNKAQNNKIRSAKQFRATSPESDALSQDLKARGFKFVGSTIMYAFMQATGLVNDHVVTCFRQL
jgi:DNA-3-methyladenine glycosylase I